MNQAPRGSEGTTGAEPCSAQPLAIETLLEANCAEFVNADETAVTFNL